MRLLHSLYRIVSMQDNDLQDIANISLIQENEIFKAHFPDMPILPGACLLQISQEFLENKLNQNVEITKFKNLKFLKTINPYEFSEITISFSYHKNEEHHIAHITFEKDEHLFCKLEYLFITK